MSKQDPQSLSGRVRTFFATSPVEMLTYDDMAVKFNCTRQQAQGVVSYLRKDGLVTTTMVVLAGRKQP